MAQMRSGSEEASMAASQAWSSTRMRGPISRVSQGSEGPPLDDGPDEERVGGGVHGGVAGVVQHQDAPPN